MQAVVAVELQWVAQVVQVVQPAAPARPAVEAGKSSRLAAIVGTPTDVVQPVTVENLDPVHVDQDTGEITQESAA